MLATRCIIDSASQRTYVTKDICTQLRLDPIRYEILTTSTFGGHTTVPSRVTVVNLQLSSPHNYGSIQVEAYVTEVITKSKFPPLTSQQLQVYEHLRGLDFADDWKSADLPIGILIGMNYYYQILGSDIRRGADNTPVAISSLFGYIVCGEESISNNDTDNTFHTFLITSKHVPLQLEDCIKKFWELESIGISAIDEFSNDEISMQIFQKFIKWLGERYEVSLLWRPDHPQLLSNYQVVLQMYYSQKQKLSKNQKLSSAYSDSMEEFIECGYVEEAPLIVAPTSHTERYTPHHPVVKEGSSTYKIRPVFNGSLADDNGISLNDCIFAGPSLIPKLMDVLIVWRFWFIAFIGDLRRAFLQIQIREEDRDALRFIWNDIIMRFTRVPFGISCSPFLLNCTIRHHLKMWKPKSEFEAELLIDIDQNSYVDDYVSGSDDEKSVLDKIHSASHIMKEAGMELRNWSSNCSQVMDTLRSENVHTESETFIKVLGIMWDTLSDELSIKPVAWVEGTVITKRTCTSFIALVYDIIGLCTPVSIRGKVFLQKLWKMSLAWDDQITDLNFLNEFAIILTEFQKIHELKIPRWIGAHSYDDVTIHLTCDASPDAYAAALYIVSGNSCMLLASKARVTPIRESGTVPRMPRYELCSCLIGARLLKKVLSLPIAKNVTAYCWTDSKIALSWIQSSPDTNLRRQVFVANRVREIRKKTDGCTWNYISSSDNPCDLATRPNMTVNSVNSSIWFSGPDWFTKHIDFWPSYIENTVLLTNSELTENENTQNVQSSPKFVPIFDLANYSRLVPALRATAYFFRLWKYKSKLPVGTNILQLSSGTKVPTPSYEEILRATQYWISYVQKTHFPEEYFALVAKKPLPKTSKILDLGPVLDEDGLIRSVGRISRSPSANSPILLPSDSKLTDLIVMQFHEKVFHSGVTLTLCEVRTKYWIVRGRQTVKRILNDCEICHRHKVLPYLQIPSALPRWRITEHPPYSYIGLDFCGPFTIREGKASVLLITCCVTRAIHCEVTPDQTAPSVINALRRFNSRRGQSVFIVSDNQKSFLKAKKLIKHLVKWTTIPERAPWWGGFWERLVQSVKRAMRRSLGRAGLTFEEFRTVIPEIESVINHRPLTYVSESRDDPQPLRPVDFLLTPGPPPLSNASLNQLLNHRLKHRVSVIKSAWKQFSKEYLFELHKWNTKVFGDKLPSVGDVVLLDPLTFTNRALFPLAIITELIMGKDGQCRAAYIRVKGKILRRSTRHLYPLELNSTTDDVTLPSDDVRNSLPVVVPSDDVTNNVPSNDVTNSVPSDDVTNIVPSDDVTRSTVEIKNKNIVAISRENLKRTRAGRLIQKPKRLGLD